MERLQKVIAASGLTSRRKAEEMITAGRVSVNGEVVRELGTQVGQKDIVTVDGERVFKEEKVYFLLNKPTGYLSTVDDPKGRKTVLDLITPEDREFRIFPVGRLDYDTAGMIFMTNDGDFVRKITRPDSNIEKEYLARVEGIVLKETVKILQSGVVIKGYKTKRARVRIESVDKVNKSTLLRIIITEGKYHQVRLMCESVGHPVKKLTRVRIGTIVLGDVPKGAYRPLKIHEVKTLMNLKGAE